MITLSVTLLVSLAALLFCAELVVRASVALAIRLHVPPLLIGLTIVAFGTSAPELLISGQAAFIGKPGLALGNIVGSNIANVLLVLGLPALLFPIVVTQHMIRRNTAFMLLASLAFVAMAWTGVSALGGTGILLFWEGATLFGLVVLFLLYAAYRALRTGADDPALQELMELEEVGNLPKTKQGITFLLLGGLAGLPLASHFLIQSATAIATEFGVPDAVIGLSVVALGTSLPELATAFSAAMHKQSAMVLGNVIGSNIFNTLAVMGITVMIANIPVPDYFLNFDLWVMLGSSFMIAPFVFARKRITAPWGLAFLVAYGVFMYWNFVGPH